MSDDVQDKDEEALEGVEDGEDPGKHLAGCQQTKDPSQTQQWQQDEGGLHGAPT